MITITKALFTFELQRISWYLFPRLLYVYDVAFSPWDICLLTRAHSDILSRWGWPDPLSRIFALTYTSPPEIIQSSGHVCKRLMSFHTHFSMWPQTCALSKTITDDLCVFLRPLPLKHLTLNPNPEGQTWPFLSLLFILYENIIPHTVIGRQRRVKATEVEPSGGSEKNTAPAYYSRPFPGKWTHCCVFIAEGLAYFAAHQH